MVADLGPGGVVFEHKTWSPLAEGSLEKYRDWAGERWSGNCVVVLITASSMQHQQDPDVALTWADVHRLLAPLAQGESPLPMLPEFLELLVSEGIGPAAPLSSEAIRAYWPAESFEKRLGALTRAVATKEDWPALLSGMTWPDENAGPHDERDQKGKVRNGWLGLDLLPTWLPGLFVGAVLNPEWHRLEPAERAQGPEFVLMLCVHLEKHRVLLERFHEHESYKALVGRLKDSGKWDLVEGQNPWHPLILRRPLGEVLKGTLTFEEQVERFAGECREVIGWMLAGGELVALRGEMERLSGEVKLGTYETQHTPAI